MGARDQLGGFVGDQNQDIDRFPDGMRVLAVDDDLIYLKILEASLRKCNYEVTTASDAKKALQILRENINKFDLVISDVQMPGMDGFQLLQHLGQEMNIPVIMVSCDGDNEFIKKGITHGACCYLVKPVTIEVFKTIWQHAFRRKTLNSIKSSDHKVFDGIKQGEEGISTSSTSSEPNGKQSKQKIKRKHQNEDDDECGDDDEDESEGPSTPKKRRIVWTEELKKKFNDIYYYLGPEKAVPNKILELMNVEGLSRGNVASHLQKFREQLKKGNINKHKQRASMVVNMGRKDVYTGIDESGGRLFNVIPLSSYMAPQMVSRSSSPTTTYPYGRLSSSSARNQNSESFDNLLRRSSNFQDNNEYCESWQGGMQGCGQIYQLPSATLLRNKDSHFGLLPANSLSISSSTPQIRNHLNDLTSICALSSSGEEFGDNVHIKSTGHVVPIIHSTPNIWREDDKQGYNHNWDLSSIVSSNDVVDPLSRRNMNSSMCDQFTWEDTSITYGVEVGNSIMQKTISSDDGLVQNGVGSLNDQVCSSVMMDEVELENELDFLDQEIGCHDIQEQKKDNSDFLDEGFGFHT